MTRFKGYIYKGILSAFIVSLNAIGVAANEKGKDISATVGINYGTNHFVNANLGIRYDIPKATFRFDYNTCYEDDLYNTALQRDIKSTKFNLSQQFSTSRLSYDNNLGLGADFRLTPKNRLSVDLKCYIPRLNIYQTAENAASEITWNRETFECGLIYTHIFKPEVSDLTVLGSVSKTWGHDKPSLYYLSGEMIGRSNTFGSPLIANAQADYKHKLNFGTISAGAKVTFRHNQMYQVYEDMINSRLTYPEALSSDLTHIVRLPSAYVMFSSKIGDRFTYKAGFRSEVSILSLDSKQNALKIDIVTPFYLPNLYLGYKLADDQDISLELTRRITYPTYPQLYPYLSMLDALTYEQGNIYMKPERATRVDLKYNLRHKMFDLSLNGYMNYVADYISQVVAVTENRLVATYFNAISDFKSGLDLKFKIKPTKWMKVSLDADTYYVKCLGAYKGVEMNNNGVSNNSSFQLDFLPWKGGNIQCQYYVRTPQYFPQLTTLLSHQMNAGVNQDLLNGALRVSLKVTDLFKTAKWAVSTQNNVFDLSAITRNKSRVLWLGVTYNFNSFKRKLVNKPNLDRSLIKFGI